MSKLSSANSANSAKSAFGTEAPPLCHIPLGYGSGRVPEERQTGDTYVLILRAVPGHWRTGPVQRLRALLKVALRGFGFRAEIVRPVAPPAERVRNDSGKGASSAA